MASTSISIKSYLDDIPGELTDYYWKFPTIESVNKHNRATHWVIYVGLIKAGAKNALTAAQHASLDATTLDNFHNKDFVKIRADWIRSPATQLQSASGAVFAWYKVDSYIVGSKIKQSSATIVTTGKNIGKANETNVICQALRDAYGKYNKQLRKTSEGEEHNTTMYLPMLASIQPEITYDAPYYVQRKYNGVRVVATYQHGAVHLYSRTRKPILTCEHVKKELEPILKARPDVYLDGEMYEHGMSLQDISGLVRRSKKGTTNTLKYMVYDCFLPDAPAMTFSARNKLLVELLHGPALTYVVPVETLTTADAATTAAYLKQFLGEGYEGVILRTDSVYEYSVNGYRSRGLIKIKPSYDGEYKMVGYTCATNGKSAGALILICETASGERFNVTPAGKIEDNKRLYEKFSKGKYFEKHYTGKMLIVTYDELSNDDVPARGRTYLQWRDMETDAVYPVE